MASTGIASGTQLVWLIEGSAIAHSQSHNITINAAARDATTKDSSGWTDNLYGVRSASGDFSGLYAYDAAYGPSDIFGLMNNKTTVTCRFTNSTSGDKYYQAEFIVTSLSIDSPAEENVTYSGSLVSTGAVTEGTYT